MQPPDQKRKTPPVTSGAFQSSNSGLGQTEHSPDSSFNQGLTPLAPSPCPIAVARQFGFLFAVYVRHASGDDERRGLYESVKTASLAARELNRLFGLERGAA